MDVVEGVKRGKSNPRIFRQDDNSLMYQPIGQRLESTPGSQCRRPQKPTAMLGEMGLKAVERDNSPRNVQGIPDKDALAIKRNDGRVVPMEITFMDTENECTNMIP